MNNKTLFCKVPDKSILTKYLFFLNNYCTEVSFKFLKNGLVVSGIDDRSCLFSNLFFSQDNFLIYNITQSTNDDGDTISLNLKRLCKILDYFIKNFNIKGIIYTIKYSRDAKKFELDVSDSFEDGYVFESGYHLPKYTINFNIPIYDDIQEKLLNKLASDEIRSVIGKVMQLEETIKKDSSEAIHPLIENSIIVSLYYLNILTEPSKKLIDDDKSILDIVFNKDQQCLTLGSKNLDGYSCSVSVDADQFVTLNSNPVKAFIPCNFLRHISEVYSNESLFSINIKIDILKQRDEKNKETCPKSGQVLVVSIDAGFSMTQEKQQEPDWISNSYTFILNN